MNAKSVEAPDEYWSIPQAIVWIISGSEASVKGARALLTIASLKQLALLPTSTRGGPPLSLHDAQAELMRAARAAAVGIFGEKWRGYVAGGMELVPVHALHNPGFIDMNGLNECAPCIIEARQLEPGQRAWTARWVRPDECMRRWPAAPLDGRSERIQIPTYPAALKYSAAAAPEQFLQWAKEQHCAGVIITVPMAEDAMRGPKDDNGNRTGGLIRQGVGLSRTTIRKWVENLPEGWQAQQGIPPSRVK